MAIKTYTELGVEAQLIANETTDGANTAERVGDTLQDIIDSAGAGKCKVYMGYLAFDGTNYTLTTQRNDFDETPTVTSTSASTFQINSANGLYTKTKTITQPLSVNAGGVLHLATCVVSASHIYVRYTMFLHDGTLVTSMPLFSYLPIVFYTYE